MLVRSLSLRRLAMHYLGDGPRSAVSVRQILGRPSGPVQLGVRNAQISVLPHNLALLVWPASYLGALDEGTLGEAEARARAGVVLEICERVRVLSPDVVGLCEVFDNDERRAIRTVLQDLYPFSKEGPQHPGPDVESDGGLLLLSKYSILTDSKYIFPDNDFPDSLASKGILHIRVRGPAWPSALDIFYSHTQNPSTGNEIRELYPDDFRGPRLSTGEIALYKQLESMHNFVDSHADAKLPALIMGDLNIAAANSAHYRKLLTTLDGFRDTWTLAGHSVTSGPTYVVDNNFYEDSDDRPSSDSRLDYILLRPGRRACPITADVEVLKFTRNDRYISDHFGVRAVFDPIAVVDP
jgi:hypothetical protein